MAWTGVKPSLFLPSSKPQDLIHQVTETKHPPPGPGQEMGAAARAGAKEGNGLVVALS